MKRTLTLLGLGLMLSAPVVFAQKPMDQASEKAVQITQGPNYLQHHWQFGHN